VFVLLVIPVEEGLAERPGIFDAAEPFREIGSIFQRLELSFRIQIDLHDMQVRRVGIDCGNQTVKYEARAVRLR